MARETEQKPTATSPTVTTTHAHVRARTPSGLEVTFTLTNTGDYSDLLAAIARIETKLLEVDYTAPPVPQAPARRNGSGITAYRQGLQVQRDSEGQEFKTCGKHNAKMLQRQSGDDTWYSHRLPDGNWCRGYPTS